MLNNPLKYTDPSGELIGTIATFWWDFATTAFTKGGLEFWNADKDYVGRAWRDFDPSASWSKTNKAWRIDRGLLVTDPNRTFAGRSIELITRFSWQAPQTVAGNIMAHGTNVIGRVNDVTYFGGMTVIDSDFTLGGISIGNVTMGPPNYRGDFRDHLFVHEYGHYRQSQRWGPLYLPAIAIPSSISAGTNISFHGDRWFEANASRLGMEYFDEHFGAGATGYIQNSPNFFDANSFVNGNPSPYNNPRRVRANTSTNPISSTFHWTDPFLYSYLLLLLI